MGSRDRDRLDTNTRIGAYLRSHLTCKKIDDLHCVRSAFGPLDAGVNVLGVFPKDHDVEFFRFLHWRRSALVVLHRPDASVQIKKLTHGYIQRTDTTPNRRR